jgi:hypothetical protein
MWFLASNPSFTEKCSAHREIQRSLKHLHPTYRHGIEYRFNNAVVHNQWRFNTVCIYISIMY